MARTIQAVQGALYRAVFLVPLPRAFVTPDLAREKVEQAGLSYPEVYFSADELPADWPRTARYTDSAAGWYLYAEGRWTAPDATVPLPDAAVQVWRDTRFDEPKPPPGAPPSPPPATPPATPPSTPPSPPPATPPATPPTTTTPASSRVTREVVALGALGVAVSVVLLVAVLERDDDDEDD